jgi:hypothetical protein
MWREVRKKLIWEGKYERKFNGNRSMKDVPMYRSGIEYSYEEEEE